MRFAFEDAWHPHFGWVRRPWIAVRLIGPRANLLQRMLVDSGADLTLLPARVAEYLGIELPSRHTGNVVGAAGVAVPYALGEIELQLGTEQFHIRVGWAFAERTPLILGRLDLFDQADILFQQNAGAITFTTPPRSPEA